MRPPIALVLLLLFFALTMAKGQDQTTYYVYDGTTLQTVHDDPARATYTNWQIWLFKKDGFMGSYTGSTGSWGSIEGKSAQSVMKQLKAEQNFEKVYERWCNCEWGADTFFNPRGPVAVIGRAIEHRPVALQKLDEIEKLYERASKVAELVQAALAKQRVLDSIPLKEYVDSVKNALDRANTLHGLMNHFIEPDLAYINQELVKTTEAVSQAEQIAPKLVAGMVPGVNPSNDTSWSGKAFTDSSTGVTSTGVNPTLGDTNSIAITEEGLQLHSYDPQHSPENRSYERTTFIPYAQIVSATADTSKEVVKIQYKSPLTSLIMSGPYSNSFVGAVSGESYTIEDSYGQIIFYDDPQAAASFVQYIQNRIYGSSTPARDSGRPQSNVSASTPSNAVLTPGTTRKTPGATVPRVSSVPPLKESTPTAQSKAVSALEVITTKPSGATVSSVVPLKPQESTPAARNAAIPRHTGNATYDQAAQFDAAKQPRQAAPLFQQACDGGYAPACTMIGHYYYYYGSSNAAINFDTPGDVPGKAMDMNRVLLLYQKGCDGGDGVACLNLGSFYEIGQEVPLDKNRAVLFYQKGCDEGDSYACPEASRLRKSLSK